MKMSKKKKVFFDMLLNIVSTAIPIVMLQLLILPLIAKNIDSDEYGLIVTIISLFNVIPATIGTVLNNIRLIHEEEYKAIEKTGDFQRLLFIYEFINAFIIFVISCYYIGFSHFIDIILVVLISVIWLAREYYIVAFRIRLNYRAILFNNLFLVLGYFIGYLTFLLLGYWQLIYLVGIMFSLIYIYKKSDIVTEKNIKTKLFKKVSTDSILLLIATVLARLINYADKLLLYPLIGGTMVSIYYVATVFGKVVSMAITPINSVALSYLSRMKKKPDNLFKYSFFLGLVICIIGYFLAIIFSKPILSIIYPKYVNAAMKYIYITTATVCVNVLTSIITPFVLKFFDIKWQIFINGITTSAYIVICLLLFHFHGMTGFCIGALISNIIKLSITAFIFIFKKENVYELENNDKEAIEMQA